ncbi:MAG: hypothetical protein AUH72_21895 [Acidobacteria bacterium 13_1_40CM_4_65_8]|nr:MAG: hypothetical protein AUH72_21895 [Acidobacteria bacterium 13_1_40CM_4_65_8]
MRRVNRRRQIRSRLDQRRAELANPLRLDGIRASGKNDRGPDAELPAAIRHGRAMISGPGGDDLGHFACTDAF